MHSQGDETTSMVGDQVNLTSSQTLLADATIDTESEANQNVSAFPNSDCGVISTECVRRIHAEIV